MPGMKTEHLVKDEAENNSETQQKHKNLSQEFCITAI